MCSPKKRPFLSSSQWAPAQTALAIASRQWAVDKALLVPKPKFIQVALGSNQDLGLMDLARLVLPPSLFPPPRSSSPLSSLRGS